MNAPIRWRRGPAVGPARLATRRTTSCLVIALTLQGFGSAATRAEAGPPNTAEDATTYLELVAEPDGRCQILSEGGQLEMLYNRHPVQPVEYRLLRVFAGDHPQGLVTGVAPPGREGVKLGCTKVDGRTQAWRIQRARFAKEDLTP